jgi:predicted ribonuclease YlaK
MLQSEQDSYEEHINTLFRKKGKNSRQRNRRHNKQHEQSYCLDLIEGQTENQEIAFDEYYNNKNLVLHGCAGTGKTFIAMYLAMKELLSSNKRKKLIIVRSIVPTRDIGFLPGNEQEKLAVYEEPYKQIAAQLFTNYNAYKYFKSKQIIEFISSSFIRGVTWDDSIILIDEMQNMTGHELDTIITRVGINSRLMLCGDYQQSDLKSNGLLEILNVLKHMNSIAHIEFDVEDIVRSGFVKEYLIAKHRNKNDR